MLRYKGKEISMSDLGTKVDKRYFTVGPKPVKKKEKKPNKPLIIIGDTESSGPFVKEQTIKLNPNVGERGTGPGSKPGAGVTIGSRVKAQKKKKTSGGVGSMGGRHSRAPR